MQIAELATTDDAGTPRCDACQWRCVLPPATVGRCLVREGTSEGIALHNHELVSGAATGPVEDFRFWHFFPDSMVLSVGSWGYAFPVDQQRGPYTVVPEDEAKRRRLDAERAATFALDRLCRGVVWAYGDPAVSYEYVLELLKLSRASSRYTALLTTGYMTLEALDRCGPYLDGVSLDLRGFSDASYERLGGISDWRGILDVAERAHTKWRCHIEVTTRIHNGVNDNPDELRALVAWISDTLGAHTPWHVLPGDAGSETAGAAVRARRIGLEAGLQFVYTAEAKQATRCPQCQAILIVRDEGRTRMVGLRDGVCDNCGHDANVQLSIFKKRVD